VSSPRFGIKKNSRLAADLGPDGLAFLRHSLGALERLLPHVETFGWRVAVESANSGAHFQNSARRSLNLVLGIETGSTEYAVRGGLRRRAVAGGVGAVLRTIDQREKDIASRVLRNIRDVLIGTQSGDRSVRLALRAGFDERVVADHLTTHFRLEIDLQAWFDWLRRLAEQTYENKAMVFGCLIDTASGSKPSRGSEFPNEFLKKKKYRALSDGYRTAYRISRHGCVRAFVDLRGGHPEQHRYFPAWCEDLAARSRGRMIGLSLTRQGDILVLDGGKLTFSYRFGRWQYWNHGHIVDLITNAARAQHVQPGRLSGVVRALYRATLDVSFRRSGGMFVLLRNRANLRSIVRPGDAIGDSHRKGVDASFDEALSLEDIGRIPRGVLAELASLDGAVVLANSGEIMSYGAVLEPRRRRGILKAEGSRTKAAIGASNYGLVLKVSSDGEITVLVSGKELIVV
jgi:hypothetical protein